MRLFQRRLSCPGHETHTVIMSEIGPPPFVSIVYRISEKHRAAGHMLEKTGRDGMGALQFIAGDVPKIGGREGKHEDRADHAHAPTRGRADHSQAIDNRALGLFLVQPDRLRAIYSHNLPYA